MEVTLKSQIWKLWKRAQSHYYWCLKTFMIAMGQFKTVLVRIWEIYYWKFERFTKNALTRSIFELEKCSFFLNGSEFRQKLIGTIISAVFPTKWATTRHFWWTLMFSLIGPSALPQCTVENLLPDVAQYELPAVENLLPDVALDKLLAVEDLLSASHRFPKRPNMAIGTEHCNHLM